MTFCSRTKGSALWPDGKPEQGYPESIGRETYSCQFCFHFFPSLSSCALDAHVRYV